MRTGTALLFGVAAAVGAGQSHAGTITIDFDDRDGMPVPYSVGMPIPYEFIVTDAYSSLGVVFSSAGDGISLSASNNPISFPNVATPTGPGPVIDFHQPVEASFWVGSDPAVVDSVSLTLTSTSSPTTLLAFNTAGGLLGTTTGRSLEVMEIEFPGAIHSVRITEGPFAFDDFSFSGLVPEPTSLALVVAGCFLAGCCRDLKKRRCCPGDPAGRAGDFLS